MFNHSDPIERAYLAVSPSFFDPSTKTDKFWKQIHLEDNILLSHPIIIENDFYCQTKGFFSDWNTCTLSIRGNYLVCKKVILHLFFRAFLTQI